MNIKEFYLKTESDYDGVIQNLLSENRAFRFLIMFKENDYITRLQAAYDEKNWKTVFNVAHDIKGVCLTLGLSRLAKVSTAVCGCCRKGVLTGDIEQGMCELVEEYRKIIDAILMLENSENL